MRSYACVDRTSADCPILNNNSDYETYIDNVLTINLYDIDYYSDNLPKEDAYDMPLGEECFFDCDSSSLYSSLKSGHSPTSDLGAITSGFRGGNKMISSTCLKTEGETKCGKSHYGLIEVEPKESLTPVEGSEASSGVKDLLFEESNDNSLDHNLLFYSMQSREILDTMNPEVSTKCVESEMNFCSGEPKQDDLCLKSQLDFETELNLTGDPQIDETQYWSIVTNTLQYPEHIDMLPNWKHRARKPKLDKNKRMIII